jgi:uncharacterized membrane protein YgdD (TMEM256/DUF423 family)
LAASRPSPALNAATAGFVLGTVLFSGTLYVRVFFGSTVLAVLTPAGGVLFMAGWLALIWYGLTAFRVIRRRG